MPTTPASPASNASVDRLTLGIESPRGAEPSTGNCYYQCNCFEAEPLGAALGPGNGICFEAEASGFTMCACMCLETE